MEIDIYNYKYAYLTIAAEKVIDSSAAIVFSCNKGFLCIFLIVVVLFRYSARNISDKCVRKEQVFETKVPEFNFCLALKHGNIVLVFFDNSKK